MVMKISERVLNVRVSYSVLLAYLAFLSLNFLYFYFFTGKWDYILFQGENGNDYFGYVLNGDSYKAYIPDLEAMVNGELLDFRPGHAISYIFYVFWMIVPYDISDVIYVSFIANNLAIIISYIYFSKIGREILGLNMRYRWIYFLNPILVYSSQMISKEAFLLAGVALICYYSSIRRFWIPLLASFVILFVRFPFSLLWPSMLFLSGIRGGRVKVGRLFFLITAFLVVAGFYADSIPFDSYVELHDSGITRLVFQYNNIYLGALLFFPFKLAASFYDLFSSAMLYSVEDGRIMLYHAVTLPIVFVLILRVREIIYINAHPLRILRSQCGGVFAFIIMYMVIVAGNLFVHSRYLWPILPIIVLFLFCIKSRYIDFRPCLLFKWVHRNLKRVKM